MADGGAKPQGAIFMLKISVQSGAQLGIEIDSGVVSVHLCPPVQEWNV